MQLEDYKDHWRLSFQDGFVQLIQVDFRLGLLFSDVSGKAQLYIESPCRLKRTEEELQLVPEEPLTLAPVLPLFNTKVEDIVVEKTGHLKVQFGTSDVIEVDADNSYEAWQLTCPGYMFVCSPGGRVSIFKEQERSAQ